MLCNTCGTQNPEGSKFCMKCGNVFTNVNANQSLNDNNVSNMNTTTNMGVNPSYNGINQNAQFENTINQNTNMANQNINNSYNSNINQGMNYNTNVVSNNVNATVIQTKSDQIGTLNIFAFIIAVILKPISSFKESVQKLEKQKNSIVLTIVLAIVMMIANLAKTVINTVREYNYFKGTYSWNWDNLKDFKWFSVIGKNFLIYLCAFLIIAGVFYLVSLIFKKTLPYLKSLAIVVSAFIPGVIGGMIVGPLLSFIYTPLSVLIIALSIVYSITILYELINDELKLESDQKVYFNIVCYGVIIVIGYFAFTKLIASNLNNPLKVINNYKDISNYFK